MTWITYFLLLFGLSWAFVGMFRWYAENKGMIDMPNARSSHIAPTPRGGGVIFSFGWLLLVVVFYYFGIVSKAYLWAFSPLLLVAIIGFWDDHHDLSLMTRFFIQCIAALMSLMILGEGGFLIKPYLNIPLPLCFLAMGFIMVWMTNLFNFMDGSDGIAATEGIFVFAFAGYMLFKAGGPELGTLAWGMVAMLAGFLTWNWPIARVFMGDCGSCFLGMMISIFALISYQHYQIPLMVWVLLTGAFWFDATITLVRRILAGDNWRKPHKLHAYQRLIQVGWSHQRVLLGLIAVNSILAVLSVLVFRDPRLSYFAFGVAIMLLFCLYVLIEIAKPMYKTWYTNAKQES
jgi:Fuc2NAc and GlcNAc transferase